MLSLMLNLKQMFVHGVSFYSLRSQETYSLPRPKAQRKKIVIYAYDLALQVNGLLTEPELYWVRISSTDE